MSGPTEVAQKWKPTVLLCLNGIPTCFICKLMLLFHLLMY